MKAKAQLHLRARRPAERLLRAWGGTDRATLHHTKEAITSCLQVFMLSLPCPAVPFRFSCFPCPALPYPAPSRPAPPCSALPCPALPCPATPCPALPSPALLSIVLPYMPCHVYPYKLCRSTCPARMCLKPDTACVSLRCPSSITRLSSRRCCAAWKRKKTPAMRKALCSS